MQQNTKAEMIKLQLEESIQLNQQNEKNCDRILMILFSKKQKIQTKQHIVQEFTACGKITKKNKNEKKLLENGYLQELGQVERCGIKLGGGGVLCFLN